MPDTRRPLVDTDLHAANAQWEEKFHHLSPVGDVATLKRKTKDVPRVRKSDVMHLSQLLDWPKRINPNDASLFLYWQDLQNEGLVRIFNGGPLNSCRYVGITLTGLKRAVLERVIRQKEAELENIKSKLIDFTRPDNHQMLLNLMDEHGMDILSFVETLDRDRKRGIQNAVSDTATHQKR